MLIQYNILTLRNTRPMARSRIPPRKWPPPGCRRAWNCGHDLRKTEGTVCFTTNWTEQYQWSALRESSLLWNMLYDSQRSMQ